MQSPSGVTGIATLLFLAATYLSALAVLMLTSPGAVSMAMGAPLLGGLELAGPYMFLIVSAAVALVGWGLLRMHNWARRLAAMLAMAGIVLLIPTVSGDVISLHYKGLAWNGLGLVIRVVIVWYLYQAPVREAFAKS